MKIFVSIILGIALVSAVDAASPVPVQTPAPAPPPACTAPEFRQFDFWLGNWKVANPQGKQVGTSEISRASGGCAVREQWKSESGVTGISINYYDAADHQWHQHWVGSDGSILHLEGGLKGETMVLEGKTMGAKGEVMNRVTWTPSPDGKVKQEWSTSTDNGSTWKTVFTGVYEK